MIKMLYLHILQADSTENWNAFCKLIANSNYKISKKSQKSVLRYIENITGSVGNFVKCISMTKSMIWSCEKMINAYASKWRCLMHDIIIEIRKKHVCMFMTMK